MPEVTLTAICADCGEEIPRISNHGQCAHFCKKCTRQLRSERAHEIIVLRTCGWCGELFVPSRRQFKYHTKNCQRLAKNFESNLAWHESHKGRRARDQPGLPPLLPEEKRAIIKKYLPLIRKKKIGSLSPVSTGLVRFADGRPNWKKEANDVKFIKVMTLQKNPKTSYYPDAGDVIRHPQALEED